MAIDPVSFKIRFPEFASVIDASIQVSIDDADLVLNSAFWQDKYDLGLYYLSAHYLSLAQKSEAGSISSQYPTASRAVDGTSVGYTTFTPVDNSDAFYSSTQYGQRYLAIRKSLGVGACVV